MKIGLIVGSLRKESWNRKIAQAAKSMFPKDVEVDFIEIGDLPLYNPDFETDSELEIYKLLRKQIRDCDGFIFFTPEYNRSYTPAIKNALDIGSRDPLGNPWAQKRGAVFSVSMGALGGMAANHALRQVFIYLDIIPIQQPEIYISQVQNSFDGDILNESTSVFVQKGVDALVASLR